VPEGCYFGRVGAEEAPRVVGRYERGVVDLDHYRGRCCDPWPAQAAEWFARERTGLTGLEELHVTGSERLDEEVSAVRLRAADGARLEVVVRAARNAAPRLLTDASTKPQSPLTFTLLDLRVESGETP
jgi:hypothetical protein